MPSIILPGRFYSQPQGPVDTVETYAAKRILFAYKLDNDFIYDGGPQRYHATASGYVQAISGSGLAWAGARNRNAASISNFVPSGSGAPITIVARVRPTGSDTAQDTLLQLGQYINDTPSRGRQIVIHHNIASARDVYISFNGQDYHTAGGVFTAGTYFDFALRYTGDVLSTSTVSVLVNGESKALTKTGASSTVLDIFPDYPVRIARDNNSTTRDYRGDIDYIYAFDGALSDAEIADIHRDPWQIFKPRRQVTYFDVAAGGGITAAVGQTTETDTAQAIAVSPIRRLLGQIVEIDTAQAVARIKILAISQTTETDAAQAVSSHKVRAVGQAGETDTAQAIAEAGAITAAVGQVAEADSAQAIAVSPLRRLLGQAAEADSAQAIASSKTRAVAAAAEADTAQAIAPSKTVALAQAAEADSAQAIAEAGAIVAAVGQAQESDAAQAISSSKTLAVGMVTETEFAQAIAHYKTLGVLQTVESDSAHSIVPAAIRALNPASESDGALAIALAGGAVASLSAPRTTYSNTQTATRSNTQTATRSNTQTARRPRA